MALTHEGVAAGVEAKAVSHLQIWTGPVLLSTAALLVFLVPPTINSPDAAENLAEFYAGGPRNLLLAGEPLALLGTFAFLLLTTRLHALVVVVDRRAGTAVLLGGGVFCALTCASLLVSTNVAGTASFSGSFTPDPATAIVLSHLGYVLMAGAMTAAAVVALAVGRSLWRTRQRRAGAAGMAVGVLALLSLPVVYPALVVFLAWIAVTTARMAGRA